MKGWQYMKDVWDALVDSTRREILKLLKKRDMSAGEIFNYFDITKPSLSHHLSILKEANLVEYKKRGQSIIYSLNLKGLNEVSDYLRWLRK